jgi:ankyrin repeat protein/mono/diheme cytochrome c family protein
MVSTPLPRGGWTPLMYAARQGALGAATALADAGANLDLRDPDGTTALNFAILNVHYDLAGMLLDKGADPNVADDTGTSPLYAAVDMHTIPADLVRPAPVLTDRLGAVDIVRALLVRGADPNVRLKRMPLGRVHQSADPSFGEGSTPLMRAAKSNDVTVMRLLLDNGADPTLTQKDHTNALMIEAAGGAQPSVYPIDRPVTEAGALDGIALLLDRGVDVDAFNGNGQTALHLAAARGADRIVNLLASRGAILDGRNKQGHTASEVALGSGRSRPGQNRPRIYEKTAALLGELAAGATAPRAVPSASRSAPAASVQSPSPIWAGIFTAEQVARGKVAFQGNCSRCHRDDLSGDEGIALNGERYQTLGPALKGETFYKNWGHGSVNRLFRKVRDAMPPDFQSIIDDNTKADVVAFVLHENGFPVGSADLPREPDVLEGVQIVRQQADVMPNFALVQVSGCLQPGSANRWKLSAASEPALAREGPLAAADVAAARTGAPGTGEFLLLNTSSFDVNAARGSRIAAKGLLYREPGRNRLTLTALQTTGSACQD